MGDTHVLKVFLKTGAGFFTVNEHFSITHFFFKTISKLGLQQKEVGALLALSSDPETR